VAAFVKRADDERNKKPLAESEGPSIASAER
jgi:hypothetical protein